MNSLIRIARKEDASAFIRIKDQLPINLDNGSTTTGGFLLGTDLKTYEYYIQHTFCIVAEVDNKVVGFGIIFNDAMVRNSDIWLRRELATWYIDLKDYESKEICYFEQLAFLPNHKRLAIRLSYNLVKWVFDQGIKVLFTTTVTKPIINLAALPFINIISGKKAGNIDERYPSIGEINSDIYLIEAETFFNKIETLAIYSYLLEHTFKFE